MARLTDAELLVLGLVAEMPRHGYELNRVIEQRGMREWTQIGFSSVYFVLGRLQRRKLVATKGVAGPKADPRTRRVYSVTAAGRRALATQTLGALRELRPAFSSVLLGMINWPALQRGEALDGLEARGAAIEAEIARLGAIQAETQPLPDHVEALFEYTIGQLRAEFEWVSRTSAYMRTKPWLD